ncbi:hypothetical protein SEA_VINCENZO_69 [Mycobacterium phage Vincenzo]|uniref:Uncharacterized protein n=2 Tax=Coopervirus vincenzo TaxID=1983110 RepID=A0A0F6WE10_9CAUD|nr:hypothetical protein SEA_VINCENZO_69 [Mycobacterium phage Vincenzo]AKF14331.1 hypothetical protein SEA_VINCENZO_69 [Mycobacterium phage Vincenzo]AKF14735.1 hypothetical protein SEA_ALANGRANT_70 [Mycobacterium phage AlanGrant]
MTLDHTNRDITRSRVDQATACYYARSRRVIVVADKGDFSAAMRALTELRDHVGATHGEQSAP